jgi:hypothetical protein
VLPCQAAFSVAQTTVQRPLPSGIGTTAAEFSAWKTQFSGSAPTAVTQTQVWPGDEAPATASPSQRNRPLNGSILYHSPLRLDIYFLQDYGMVNTAGLAYVMPPVMPPGDTVPPETFVASVYPLFPVPAVLLVICKVVGDPGNTA